jgi:hypothetical protein
MCGETLFGDLEDINRHIDKCLSQVNANHHVNGGADTVPTSASTASTASTASAPASSTTSKSSKRKRGRARANQDCDDADDQPYEVYTFGGIERIRTCSLLEGGSYSAALQLSTSEHVDIDDDLDIDDDETGTFGAAQYSIDNLIRQDEEDCDELINIIDDGPITESASALESITTESDTTATPTPATPTAEQSIASQSHHNNNNGTSTSTKDTPHTDASGTGGGQDKSLLIEALKAKIISQV